MPDWENHHPNPARRPRKQRKARSGSSDKPGGAMLVLAIAVTGGPLLVVLALAGYLLHGHLG